MCVFAQACIANEYVFCFFFFYYKIKLSSNSYINTVTYAHTVIRYLETMLEESKVIILMNMDLCFNHKKKKTVDAAPYSDQQRSLVNDSLKIANRCFREHLRGAKISKQPITLTKKLILCFFFLYNKPVVVLKKKLDFSSEKWVSLHLFLIIGLF